jgi:hypothetical protein
MQNCNIGTVSRPFFYHVAPSVDAATGLTADRDTGKYESLDAPSKLKEKHDTRLGGYACNTRSLAQAAQSRGSDSASTPQGLARRLTARLCTLAGRSGSLASQEGAIESATSSDTIEASTRG